MSNMTPISASALVSPESATKPGVNGPIAMPATRYPISGGSRRRLATKPKANASTKPMAMVAISDAS
ncbi:hypothetical protein D3C83_227770 [compost metagenome]